MAVGWTSQYLLLAVDLHLERHGLHCAPHLQGDTSLSLSPHPSAPRRCGVGGTEGLGPELSHWGAPMLVLGQPWPPLHGFPVIPACPCPPNSHGQGRDKLLPCTGDVVASSAPSLVRQMEKERRSVGWGG